MPEPFLSAAIRRRPYLIHRVPAGRSVRWHHYQGDITVWFDRSNDIEVNMIDHNYDDEVIRSIKCFVGSSAQCVDVGANVGAVSLVLANLVGPSGRVLAIEPGPPYRDRLRANLSANPTLQSRVNILPIGISDAPGTMEWIPDPLHPFNASLSPVAYFSESANVRVSVSIETLDEVIGRLGWDRLDFIKIDVEGMELEVFRGAQRTLEKLRPVVLFESMACFRDYRREKSGIDIFKEISEFLGSIDYGAYKLTTTGEPRECTNFETWTDTNDTLAIHKSKFTGKHRCPS